MRAPLRCLSSSHHNCFDATTAQVGMRSAWSREGLAKRIRRGKRGEGRGERGERRRRMKETNKRGRRGIPVQFKHVGERVLVELNGADRFS